MISFLLELHIKALLFKILMSLMKAMILEMILKTTLASSA